MSLRDNKTNNGKSQELESLSTELTRDSFNLSFLATELAKIIVETEKVVEEATRLKLIETNISSIGFFNNISQRDLSKNEAEYNFEEVVIKSKNIITKVVQKNNSISRVTAENLNNRILVSMSSTKDITVSGRTITISTKK